MNFILKCTAWYFSLLTRSYGLTGVGVVATHRHLKDAADETRTEAAEITSIIVITFTVALFCS